MYFATTKSIFGHEDRHANHVMAVLELFAASFVSPLEQAARDKMTKITNDTDIIFFILYTPLKSQPAKSLGIGSFIQQRWMFK
jgi:hypothetical protein